MTDNPKVKKILAIVGLEKFQEAVIRDMLHSSLNGLKTNTKIFPNVPVPLNVYESDITLYDASIPAALDGSMTAVALKNKLKRTAIDDYVLQAHYVEGVAANDMATFLLSGFQPRRTTKTAPGPLPAPDLTYVLAGPGTGQAKVKVKRDPQAISGDVRYGVVPPAGGVPGTWTEIRLSTWRPTIVSGLTPGAMYTFQARALGPAGLTDWGNPINRMVS